ncbi:glycosyl transferase family 1 [Photobacterium phosphoreum]|uniref:glycosyltransferase n=1 Tax=Photobacterium phosphoreum TaxID=659 RepID=UPI000D1720DA|nr:glycosyltransferase [Photobacterium phosphoreum]PSU64863.1 glycosyl transferase family 1 [Photobacterium phosphoreum]PSW06411.1 glycosyl transferase family 1 [Photobacterium phosphoreum]
MINKVLINASNLHFGGGVQVAASFINDLYDLGKFDISIVCSTAVLNNLSKHIKFDKFKSFNEFNVFGLNKLKKLPQDIFDGYDLCFTVFGPFYFNIKVKKHICGFAQPWIAYPKNKAYKNLSSFDYIKTKIKFSIQSLFFRQYDHLIVEQQHIKNALIDIGYNKRIISVVSNTVSSIYDSPESWESIVLNKNKLKHPITLGFIGRDYPHKNIKILIEVNRILNEKHNFYCNFLFTFTEEEMKRNNLLDLDDFLSLGVISIRQCPEFYNSLDGLIFPSLLECFSASPIEAMKMNTVVFASQYPFISEVCKTAAFYFDPTDANSIASSIVNAFSNEKIMEEKRRIGTKIASELPKSHDRTIAYLSIIKNLIK